MDLSDDSKSASASGSVKYYDLIETSGGSQLMPRRKKEGMRTHYIEESFRVHTLRRRKVCTSLLERVHRSTNAVEGGDAGYQRKD